MLFIDLDSREKSECANPVHIINIDIQDNHEEATIGAFIIKDLVSTVSIYFCLQNFKKGIVNIKHYIMNITQVVYVFFQIKFYSKYSPIMFERHRPVSYCMCLTEF